MSKAIGAALMTAVAIGMIIGQRGLAGEPGLKPPLETNATNAR